MSDPGAPRVGEPVIAAVPRRAAVPWRGFFLDSLLAGTGLFGLSIALIVPIVLWHAMTQTAAGKTVHDTPDLMPVMPAITIAAIVAMLLTALLVWWLRGRRLPGRLERMAAWPAAGLAVVAGIGIQLGAQAFGQLLDAVGAGMEPSNAQPISALVGSMPWLAGIMVVVVAPFAEELLMRHVLLRRFALAGRAAVGVLLTSLAFAMLHEPLPGDAGVPSWLGGLALYAGMGAGFALVYLRTGRFGAAFLAHAVCNAAALAAVAYSVS